MALRAIALFLMLAPIAIGASGPAFSQERTGVLVRVVLASSAERGFDPALSNIHRQLSSLFGYSSYRLIDQQSFNLAFGEQGFMSLPGSRPGPRIPGFRGRFTPGVRGRALEVTPLARVGDFIEMRVRMEGVLDTRFRIRRGGTILIGGPSFGPGVLIVALSAE